MIRRYRVIMAATTEGLVAVAGTEWTILLSTIREFSDLQTNHDHSLGRIGSVVVDQIGFVCLAYKQA